MVTSVSSYTTGSRPMVADDTETLSVRDRLDAAIRTGVVDTTGLSEADANELKLAVSRVNDSILRIVTDPMLSSIEDTYQEWAQGR